VLLADITLRLTVYSPSLFCLRSRFSSACGSPGTVPIVSIPFLASLDTELEVDILRIGNSSLAFLATTSEGLVSDSTWQCISNGNIYFANASADCGKLKQLSVVKATSGQIPDSIEAATNTFTEDSWTAIFDRDVTCTICSAPRSE
jgi:hypothetical protein